MTSEKKKSAENWFWDRVMGKKERMFPIIEEQGIPGKPVTWAEAEIAYRAYSSYFGSHYSLERLAKRGGFGRQEFSILYTAATDPAYSKLRFTQAMDKWREDNNICEWCNKKVATGSFKEKRSCSLCKKQREGE